MITDIGNPELKRLMAETPGLRILDVRTPEEYFYLGHIPGATLLPLHELPLRWQELSPSPANPGTALPAEENGPIVVVCQHGVRSLDASHYLYHLGFRNILNLAAGMAAWDGPVEAGPPETDANTVSPQF